jgi:predicted Zn-dependent protease
LLVRQHPDDPQIASRAILAYLAMSDVTNALQLVEERLAKSPDDVPSLNAKAMILMQSGQAAAALILLDHVLALTNLPAVHVNRAFALIATQDFVQAKRELNELENSGTAAGWVDFGLAQVAEHGYDTNSARHYLQLCLSNTPTGAPLWEQANARLRMLETAK